MKVQRLSNIAKVFIEEGLGYLLGATVGTETRSANSPSATSELETAARLRRTLERLGPTFVKFGQLLATRVDLFSDDFTQELSKLHSSVPPFANETAYKTIEAELGKPLSEIFDEISPKPIASASIAQVYRARLKGSDKSVAVKVQRPSLEESLIQDLELLVQISSWIDALVPPYHRSMIHAVTKEYALRSRMEINFLAEARAISKFGICFQRDDFFHIPKVFPDLCTSKLVVMEWVEGTMLDKIKNSDDLSQYGFEPYTFAKNLLRLQLCMAYEHGFMHADTHPGNLILMPTGKVGLIDFGLHATISTSVRQKIFESLLYQSEGKVDEQVEVLAEFSPPANPKDNDKYKHDLREMLLTVSSPTGPAISRQLVNGMRIGAKYRTIASAELLIIVRNLTIIEGINLKIYPQLEPDKEMGAILQDILRRRFSFDSLHGDATSIVSHLALTLSRRPALTARLLKIERNLADAKSLGDFLRKEGVIQENKQHGRSRMVMLATFLFGFLLATALSSVFRL